MKGFRHMCSQHAADNMIIQCHFADISEKQAEIRVLQKKIEDAHNEIKRLIRDGATSGDQITDLIYLMGFHIGRCAMLHSTIDIFFKRLSQHPGEFIIVEYIELTETFHGDPDQQSPFPKEAQKRYVTGIITPLDAFPFRVDLTSPPNEFPRVLLQILHAQEIELPIGMIAQFNQCDESTADQYFVQVNPSEPRSISCSQNQQMRFWIGNDAAALCLHNRNILEREHARGIAQMIRRLAETQNIQIAEQSQLAHELADPHGFLNASEGS